MQQDGRNDLTAQNAPQEPRKLTRRDFARTLTAATVGGGLMSAAFAGCALTRSQRAEATEAIVDNLGKVPKVKIKRLGNMELSRICIASDWNNALYAPALAAGINFVHKASYWRETPEEFKKLPRESF